MARQRRTRDYKAEERRRNELARVRGYRNRGEQRRSAEHGASPPLRPERLRSPGNIQAYATWLNENRYAAFDWTGLHSRSWMSQYDYDRYVEVEERDGRKPLGEVAYLRAYLAAWVQGDERYGEVRRREGITRENHKERKGKGSPALRHWLVDVIHAMTPNEYDARYNS